MRDFRSKCLRLGCPDAKAQKKPGSVIFNARRCLRFRLCVSRSQRVHSLYRLVIQTDIVCRRDVDKSRVRERSAASDSDKWIKLKQRGDRGESACQSASSLVPAGLRFSATRACSRSGRRRRVRCHPPRASRATYSHCPNTRGRARYSDNDHISHARPCLASIAPSGDHFRFADSQGVLMGHGYETWLRCRSYRQTTPSRLLRRS